MTYIALAWLAGLMLAAHAGASVPAVLGMVVFCATLWAVAFLFFKACRRWPLVGWIALGFFGGLFGVSRRVYVHNEITVDDEGNEVAVYDNCDAANDCSYDSSDDGGGSSDSRED